MKRILIISSNRLGDSILSSGLNSYFKSKYKDSHITLVCGELPCQLFKYCKNIDKVITIEKKSFSLHWFILWKKTVFIHWEEIIDLRGSLISYFLLGKNRKVFRKKKNLNLHKVVEVSNLVADKLTEPNIEVSNVSFKNKFYGRKIISICPTANWSPKIWPQENFIKLIQIMSQNSIFREYIFVLVGPKFEEFRIKKIIATKNKKIINMYGKFSLIEIYLFFKKCKLFIGNDSGLMHLAALANTKTVGLFGPSNVNKYGPWGEKNLCISGSKSPEQLMGHKNFDSKKDECLMEDLKVDLVFKEILKFYKK